MGARFRVTQLDHVHVYVPDRYEAAKWYRAVMGLEIVPEHENWALEEGGPLTISSDGGSTSLALFAGEAAAGPGPRPSIAFRVGGDAFLAFLTAMASHGLVDRGGNLVKPEDAVDHGESYSIYFRDPWGNPYEITTYDAAHVRARLKPR